MVALGVNNDGIRMEELTEQNSHKETQTTSLQNKVTKEYIDEPVETYDKQLLKKMSEVEQQVKENSKLLRQLKMQLEKQSHYTSQVEKENSELKQLFETQSCCVGHLQEELQKQARQKQRIRGPIIWVLEFFAFV